MDSIQEIAYQTSNYAAEFGQAGVAVINMTMKSGTNQYHGSGYDYFVNEDLNAGNPFSSDPIAASLESTGRATAATISAGPWAARSISPRFMTATTRRSSSSTTNSILESHAVQLYRHCTRYRLSERRFFRDFTKRKLQPLRGVRHSAGALPATDALGRPMYANAIYDPRRGPPRPAVSGMPMCSRATSFPPTSSIRPRKKIIALLPLAQNANLVGNYSRNRPRAHATRRFRRSRSITTFLPRTIYPSIWSRINTESQISSPLGERGRSAYRHRWVSWHVHPQLHNAAQLRSHRDADDPAAPGRGLLSHQFQRPCALPEFRPGVAWAQWIPDPSPVPVHHRNVHPASRLRRDRHAPAWAECRISEKPSSRKITRKSPLSTRT